VDTRNQPLTSQDSPDRSAVKVIAHRGSSDARAEHTLAAYALAVAEGADGLEAGPRTAGARSPP
jgi:glycerophosphoryl diester phosphodiesterase